jgi:hypothetical protein
MMSRLRARATYANVIATLALFFALSGTGYALSLPKNSVGNKQLKKNAVTSIKVKDHSLKAVDVAPGQGNVAFAAYRDSISPPTLPLNATTVVMTLHIPVAGQYVIFSKVPMDDLSGGATTQCTLHAGGDFDTQYVITNGIGEWPCNNEVVHVFAAPGNVTLALTTSSSKVVRAGDGKIIAVQVGSLTNTHVTS